MPALPHQVRDSQCDPQSLDRWHQSTQRVHTKGVPQPSSVKLPKLLEFKFNTSGLDRVLRAAEVQPD